MIRHIARIVVLKVVFIAVLSVGISGGCGAGGVSSSPYEALALVKELDLSNVFEAWMVDMAGMQRLAEVREQLSGGFAQQQ